MYKRQEIDLVDALNYMQSNYTPQQDIVLHWYKFSGGCDNDNYPDPVESLNLAIALRNMGAIDVTNVSATISTTNSHITILDGTKDYGTISGHAANVDTDIKIQTFTLRVDYSAQCGESATFTIDITGDSYSKSLDFTVPLERDKALVDKFWDMENGGAEPAEWYHFAKMAGTDGWSLVSDRTHSGSYSWFCADVAEVRDSCLVSPEFLVEENTEVRFWHWYDTESGWDGGVIEVTTNFDGSEYTSAIDIGLWATQGGYNAVSYTHLTLPTKA